MPSSAHVDIRVALEALIRLNASRRVFANQTAAAGVSLSLPAYTLLRRVHQEGPLPMGQLARLTHMDPGATARQIAQLEAAGLVHRSPSPGDGRVILVSTTATGDAVRARMGEVLHVHQLRALDAWEDEEVDTLARLLGRLVEDLRATEYPEVVAATHGRTRAEVPPD